MIRISKPIGATQAQSYHLEVFRSAADNYYSQGETIDGQWRGRLAAAFGLHGAVEVRAFNRLTEGRHPHTGEALIRIGTGQSYVDAQGHTVTPMAHRAVWDMNLSPDKSVSVAALVGGDERIRVAHRESVDAALTALERYTQARMGGLRAPETTGRFVVAIFEHDSSRPVLGYAAPQLHTHALLMNMTQTDGGRYRAIQEREWFKSQAYASAIYDATLALKLQALGYQVAPGPYRQPAIVGFTPEYLDAMSPRRQQIVAYLKAEGREGPRAAEIAARETREEKTALTPDEVLAQHQVIAAAHGDQPRLLREQARSYNSDHAMQGSSTSAKQFGQFDELSNSSNSAREAVQYGKERQMERSAVVEDRSVLTDALRYGMGHVNASAVHQEFERRVVAEEFLPRARNRGSAARAFTTPAMVAAEEETLARMRANRGHHPPIQVGPVTTPIHLNPDQQAAVAQILTAPDKILALDGIAGSGKTTALAAVHGAARAAGYEVVGLAPTSTAAQELGRAGIPTTTVHRFLAATPVPTQPRLYVLDESSLASTGLLLRLLQRIEAQPGDRVLLAGDGRQHQAVEAGIPFEQFKRDGGVPAALTTVVRQRGPGYRRIVGWLASGDIRTAIADLTRRGKVHEIPARADRLAAVAAAFVASPQNTIVIAPDNKSRQAINAVIHTALHEQRAGHAETPVLVPKADMTLADRVRADRYTVGDVLRYGKGSALGVQAGDYATVVRTDRATNTLEVERPNGTRLVYDPARLHGVAVYERQARAFVVGDRVQVTANTKQVANRSLGTIARLDAAGVLVRFDKGGGWTYPATAPVHLDYGYAVTSYSSQSLTADRVLVHLDSDRSSEGLVNQRLAYVALSRGRHECLLFTDDARAMGHNLGRDVSHRAAIEHPRQIPLERVG